MILLPSLNEKILDIATSLNYSVSDRAPGTYEALRAQSNGLMVVWAGASDGTIYGDRRVNWAFRAWHDSLHLALNADFTLTGELLVAKEQARILGGQLGEIILAEVEGQAGYYAANGYFPEDQVTFMRDYLAGKGIRL